MLIENKNYSLSETESYIVRSSIESGVRVARECCCDCAQAIKDKKKPIDEFVSTGIEHSQCKLIQDSKFNLRTTNFYKSIEYDFKPRTYFYFILVAFDYLNQPANGIHRTGAIATGAIAGYIIAIRRGFFRRFMSTSIGGFGIASICYPKEAEIYWKQALGETKTYATILYNFAYGGKG